MPYAGNRFYARFEDVINAALRIFDPAHQLSEGRTPQAAVVIHKKVLDAIEAGDANKARATMEGIISEVLDLIQHGQKEEQARPDAASSRASSASHTARVPPRPRLSAACIGSRPQRLGSAAVVRSSAIAEQRAAGPSGGCRR